MMNARVRRWAFCIAQVAVLASLMASAHAQSTRYAGRLLADVLRGLQVDGLKIVFSSNLVRPDARVLAEPKARTPRRILDEILRPHGLEARAGDAGTLLIVRSARGGERPQTSAVAAAAAPVDTGNIAGRVVDANTGAPVPDVIVMVQQTGHSTQTDEQGAFELAGVPQAATTCSCRRSGIHWRGRQWTSRAGRPRR